MANRRSEYGWWEWLRERRLELGPLYLGVPVLLTGLIAHALLNDVQTGATVVVASAAGLALASTRRGQAVRKIYFGAVTAFIAGWVWAAHVLADTQPAWTWLLFVAVVGGGLVSIPWWLDRIKRTQVHMEHVIRSWPIRAERAHLSGTALTNLRVTAIGWTARLAWLPGARNVDDVLKRKLEIEGALGLQSGQLRVEPDGRSTNSIRLIVVKNDPHSTSLPWEIPTTQVDGELVLRRLRAADGVRIGVREDGVVKTVNLWRTGWGACQMLIAGIKGSGKSMAANIIWATLACCDDVVQWGIDLKGGMELTPWRGVFDWIATDAAEAQEMMNAVLAIIHARTRLCAQRGWKVWPASKENPILVVSADEVAQLLGMAKSKDLAVVETIAQMGRAVGVVIILATQYPTLDALGSSQIRQQIDQRLCFRMADSSGERYVIPDHVVDAHKIDSERPGTGYHLDGDKFDPMPLRTYNLADETITQLVSLLSGYTTPLDPVSTSAATESTEETGSYADRERYVMDDSTDPENRDTDRDDRDEDRDVDRAEAGEDDREIPEFQNGEGVSMATILGSHRAAMTEEQRARFDAARAENDEPDEASVTEADARERLRSKLREAGANGVGPTELARACHRGRTWAHARLNELAESGQAVRTGRGTWASSASGSRVSNGV